MSTALWLLVGGALVLCRYLVPQAALWVAACWFAAPAVSWCLLLLTRRRVQAQLSCPATAEKGKAFSVSFSLRHTVPYGRAECHMEAENIATGEKRLYWLALSQSAGNWEITSDCCGCLRLRCVGVRLWDIFGVLPLPASCDAHGITCVMPDTFAVEAEAVTALRSQTDCDEYAPDRRGNDPSETFQMREYASGDSLRQIHWKLSGKLGRTVVRDGSEPADHRLTVYVDRCPAPPRLTDALLEAAVSLAQGFAEQGQPFRLLWRGNTDGGRDITRSEELPEAVAELLKSAAAPEPMLPEELSEGAVLYFCTRLPEERTEAMRILLCADAPCEEDGVVCFTPENMTEILGKWIWE